jgi:hypothetical protein
MPGSRTRRGKGRRRHDPRTGQVVTLARFARGELARRARRWPIRRLDRHRRRQRGERVRPRDDERPRSAARPGARPLVADGSGARVGVAGGTPCSASVTVASCRLPLGMPSNGYGPSLAAAGRVWVAEGDALVELDPAHGAVVDRTRLPRGTQPARSPSPETCGPSTPSNARSCGLARATDDRRPRDDPS